MANFTRTEGILCDNTGLAVRYPMLRSALLAVDRQQFVFIIREAYIGIKNVPSFSSSVNSFLQL